MMADIFVTQAGELIEMGHVCCVEALHGVADACIDVVEAFEVGGLACPRCSHQIHGFAPGLKCRCTCRSRKI